MTEPWRALDAPSARPATSQRPSRCPDAEVVQVCPCEPPINAPHRPWCREGEPNA